MSENLNQADIDYIREGYRLFRAGDPAFLDRYEPDAKFIFPASLPKGGVYESPMEAMEFFIQVTEWFEDGHPVPEEFIRDGDRLVVLGHFRGRSRATGEQVAIRFAHLFRLSGASGPISEQKNTSFELFGDTAALLAARGDEGAA